MWLVLAKGVTNRSNTGHFRARAFNRQKETLINCLSSAAAFQVVATTSINLVSERQGRAKPSIDLHWLYRVSKKTFVVLTTEIVRAVCDYSIAKPILTDKQKNYKRKFVAIQRINWIKQAAFLECFIFSLSWHTYAYRNRLPILFHRNSYPKIGSMIYEVNT